MSDQYCTLPDGRRLSYALYGPPEGLPVLYFHGTPSSRLEPLLLQGYGIVLAGLLADAGIRLIAMDRPGMGLSSFDAGGSFLSFADDAACLMDALRLDVCDVLCWSGGGPYALAMGYRHPGRTRAVHIICGFTRPFEPAVMKLMGLNKWYFRLAKAVPFFLQPSMMLLSRQKNLNPIPQKLTGLPWCDYVLIREKLQLDLVARTTLREACRQGARGPVQEARRYYNDFGFPLSAISRPVHYWWGMEDRTVIRPHAEAVEQQVPNAFMHYREGEGHLSLYVHGFREVLQTIRRQ